MAERFEEGGRALAAPSGLPPNEARSGPCCTVRSGSGSGPLLSGLHLTAYRVQPSASLLATVDACVSFAAAGYAAVLAVHLRCCHTAASLKQGFDPF